MWVPLQGVSPTYPKTCRDFPTIRNKCFRITPIWGRTRLTDTLIFLSINFSFLSVNVTWTECSGNAYKSLQLQATGRIHLLDKVSLRSQSSTDAETTRNSIELNSKTQAMAHYLFKITVSVLQTYLFKAFLHILADRSEPPSDSNILIRRDGLFVW